MSISETEYPRAWARTTKNRCQSCRMGSSSRTSRRNAFMEFRSETGTSKILRLSQL